VRFKAMFFCWHYSIASTSTTALSIRQPAREGVSPYRFAVSTRMSKWLNPLYCWCSWQMIRAVGDQLKANEISLLGGTPEKREAAKK